MIFLYNEIDYPSKLRRNHTSRTCKAASASRIAAFGFFSLIKILAGEGVSNDFQKRLMQSRLKVIIFYDRHSSQVWEFELPLFPYNIADLGFNMIASVR